MLSRGRLRKAEKSEPLAAYPHASAGAVAAHKVLPWFPYQLPRGRLSRFTLTPRREPWFPYQLPRGRLLTQRFGTPSRGFPTSFPVVG